MPVYHAGQDDTFAFCMCSRESQECVFYLTQLGSRTEVATQSLHKMVLGTSRWHLTLAKLAAGSLSQAVESCRLSFQRDELFLAGLTQPEMGCRRSCAEVDFWWPLVHVYSEFVSCFCYSLSNLQEQQNQLLIGYLMQLHLCDWQSISICLMVYFCIKQNQL